MGSVGLVGAGGLGGVGCVDLEIGDWGSWRGNSWCSSEPSWTCGAGDVHSLVHLCLILTSHYAESLTPAFQGIGEMKIEHSYRYKTKPSIGMYITSWMDSV